MTSLLDQSALTELAERLVDCRARGRRRCRRRGRGALGVARRSRCATARSRNPSAPKATMSACACWSAGARRWSRPTTSAATASRRSPSARSRWRGSRPRTLMPASPTPTLLARRLPRSRSARSRHAVGRSSWKSGARAPKRPALAVQGVTKSGGASASAGIGGMVLVTSHGFLGAYLGSRYGLSMTAIAGEGTGDGARLRFLLGAACRRSRRRREDRPHAPASARSSGSIRARSTTQQGAGRLRSARRRLAVGHLAGAINGASVARKTSFLKDKMGEQLFAPGIRIVDDPLRRRGLRSRPFDGEGVAGERAGDGRGRRAEVLVPRLRDRARARLDDHRPCAARRLVGAVAGRRPICISSRARLTPERADRATSTRASMSPT